MRFKHVKIVNYKNSNFNCFQTCVKSCPQENWTYLFEEGKATTTSGTRQQKADAIDWNKFICEYGYNPRQNYLDGVVSGLLHLKNA